MTIIWVTGTNWKTTTCNIIAKWLRHAGKKVFMFSTVNIILWENEYTNDTKMTSPDPFELQRLLGIAKNQWCEIAIIETASHGIKMNRIWWLQYDICVLTNITQDHLDLHRTMEDYVNTKLSIFKNLMIYKRKKWVKKTAVINADSQYADLFLSETYDSVFTYGNSGSANLRPKDITYTSSWMKFGVDAAGWGIDITTSLRGGFNVENILAAIWVFVSFGMKSNIITEIIKNISWVPWRMETLKTNTNFQIIIDYAHTPHALKNILEYLKSLSKVQNLIVVFGAAWDRDKTTRPLMGKTISNIADKVILTQDDDYSEKTEDIIKDILPWVERKEWEGFWIIPERKEAIRTALVSAWENDIVLIAGKWDEHTMITNRWPIKWHDKTIVEWILKEIDENKIIE